MTDLVDPRGRPYFSDPLMEALTVLVALAADFGPAPDSDLARVSLSPPQVRALITAATTSTVSESLPTPPVEACLVADPLPSGDHPDDKVLVCPSCGESSVVARRWAQEDHGDLPLWMYGNDGTVWRFERGVEEGDGADLFLACQGPCCGYQWQIPAGITVELVEACW